MDTKNPADLTAFDLYRREMESGQLIDFADMIGRAAELFRLRPDVLQSVRDKFQYGTYNISLLRDMVMGNQAELC